MGTIVHSHASARNGSSHNLRAGDARALLSTGDLLGRLLTVGVSAIVTAQLWSQRSRQRRALLALDDYRLRDLGLTRRDALTECRKAFWQA